MIDSVTGEACDDGNTDAGDGCDASCQFESCSFFNVGALGSRTFSIDAIASGQFLSVFGLGVPVANITFTSGDFDFIASPTDAGGTSAVTLSSDVIVAHTNVQFSQCIKYEAAGTTGELHCCGGHAVGVSRTRDSNAGGSGGNGPTVTLTEVGGGGPGDLLMAFQISTAGAPSGSPEDCATASYGSSFTQFWTTGTATGRVVRAEPFDPNDPTLEFSTSGQAFDCSTWTTTDDVGALANPDTALNFVPGIDGALLTIYEHNGGN